MTRQTPIFRRTKLVATMGPAVRAPEVLEKLIFLGIDVCRLNMSHGSFEDHKYFIDLIRAINKKYDLYTSILLDLQGPKIRIGRISEPVKIKPGQTIWFDTKIKDTEKNEEGEFVLPTDYPDFAKDVTPGALVLVEDGKIKLKVLETDKKRKVKLEVLQGSALKPRKGINLPDVPLSTPSITEQDKEAIKFGAEQGVDWVALSFVRRPEEIFELKELLKKAGSNAKIIAKIEKPEALRNIDAIIAASDAIMVARGDLGVEIPIEEVPFWQKKIVEKCNRTATPVIVATQMLDSMIENSSPTRAEATDVANAVLDGADALMLSGETSVGKFPLEAVRTMDHIIGRAEKDRRLYERQQPLDPRSKTFYSDAICLGATILASAIHAKAIIGMTRSGYTAFQVARHRPKSSIFIFTDNRPLINALNLVWGVRAFYYDRFVGTNESIRDVIQILKDKNLVKNGDIVVNTASMPLEEQGRTNMMKYTIVK